MSETRLLDISLPLVPGLPQWPGSVPFSTAVRALRDENGYIKVTILRLNTHTGTHLDAPAHMLENGAGSDSIALDTLIGGAFVAEFDAPETIGAAELERAAIPPGTLRLLLKTRNSSWISSRSPFREDFVALDQSGAQWLLARGIRLVGIDGFSIEPFTGSGLLHRTLMEQGVVILECLSLAEAEPGPCELLALPMALRGTDGAPVRAVLRYEG